jgi:uncharacterized membrane protein YdbT with pleckstrin-like domain
VTHTGKSKISRVNRVRDTKAVEDALLRRAVGYTAREVYIAPVDGGDMDSPDEKIVKIVEKQVAPNIQAALAWLSVMKPDLWGKGRTAATDSDSALLYKALEGTTEGDSEGSDDV